MMSAMLKEESRLFFRRKDRLWEEPGFRLQEHLAKGLLHWEAAQSEEAKQHFWEAKDLAKNLSEPISFTRATLYLLALYRTDSQTSARLLEQTLREIGGEIGCPFYLKEYLSGLQAMGEKKWSFAKDSLLTAAWGARVQSRKSNCALAKVVYNHIQLELCRLWEMKGKEKFAINLGIQLIKNRLPFGILELEARLLVARCMRKTGQISEAAKCLKNTLRLMGREQNWASYDELLRELYELQKIDSRPNPWRASVLADLLLH